MRKKVILMSLIFLFSFNHFGSHSDVEAADTSLTSFSSGALLMEKPPGYDSVWDFTWIMDENPKTGWCSPKGKVSNNVSVIELAEKSVLESIEFDTGNIDGSGRGAKDIVLEISADGISSGYAKIKSVSLSDKKDNQTFQVTDNTPGKWLRLTIKNNHGSKDYTELMDFRAYGKQLTKTKLADISGTYKTNFNDFHLRQQGTSVTGCYEYDQGLFNGGLENNIMRLTWSETDQKGPAVMIFNSEGNNFLVFGGTKGRRINGQVSGTVKKSLRMLGVVRIGPVGCRGR